MRIDYVIDEFVQISQSFVATLACQVRYIQIHRPVARKERLQNINIFKLRMLISDMRSEIISICVGGHAIEASIELAAPSERYSGRILENVISAFSENA